MANKYEAQQRYQDKTRRRVVVNLNTNTDQDILEHLEQIGSIQGYIKGLIRADLAKQSKSE